MHGADVAPQYRGQVGVDERRVAAGDELHEWAYLVGDRYLREADVAGYACGELLVLRVPVSMQQHDGHALDASRMGGFELLAQTLLVQRLNDLAVRAVTLFGLDHVAIEHLRQLDVEREDIGALLRAYSNRIREPGRYDQHGGLPVALEQRIGPNGRAHLYGAN